MYDVACKFSEYVKAREGGYFKDTMFFHDGFKHQCPKFLTASRLAPNQTTTGTNSFVAEQINGFLGRKIYAPVAFCFLFSIFYSPVEYS